MESNYKYKTLGDFRKAHSTEYNYLSSKGLLIQLCEDMGWKYTPKLKSCGIEEVLKTTIGYESYSDWRKGERTYYRLATRFKLTNQVCEERGWEKRLPNGHWTKERCIEEARKYKTVSNWEKNSSGSRSSAQDNGWMEECCSHMVYDKKPSGYWTKELCLEEARKYKHRKAWRLNSKGSWSAARRFKIFKECTSHMEVIKTWKRVKKKDGK